MDSSNQPSDIVIAKPKPEALAAQFAPLVERVASMVVTTEDEDRIALETLRELTRGKKMFTELFEPTRKSLDTAKKDLLALRDGFIAPLETAIGLLNDKEFAFQREQRRIAAEAEAAATAAALKAEQERQLQEAIDAESAGDGVLADQILAEPVVAPVVHIPAAVAQVKGISSAQLKSAEVVDFPALVKYVAEHPEWMNLLLPNGPALNKIAQAQGTALRIPGVRLVLTESRRVGR